MSSSTSFEQSWAFASEIKKELGASGYDINDTPENFSTGRARLEAVFYEGEGHNRKVIETRTAMRLISKKTGKPYEVVSRKPNREPSARPAPRQASPERSSKPAAYTLDDVLNA
jgi:hypothetical protein